MIEKSIKLFFLVLLYLSMNACAQQTSPNFFEVDVLGHKFKTVQNLNTSDKRITHGLWDNYTRDWPIRFL